MTNRTTKKGKKPLQTTLGKACLNDKEEIDLSHVRRPIDTSIFGLRHVLTLFQTATEEVKNYITYECDIMYECRICKTIYRSLANFILHKRNYCREKYIPSVSISRNCGIQDYAHRPRSPEGTNILESRSLITPEPTEKNDPANKGLSPVIEKLKEKQEINRLTSEILSKDLSNEEPNQTMSCPLPNRNLLLEEIATNNAAVFQTVLQSMSSEDLKNPEFMKSEVMEIHGILDSDEAVLGADGKICNFQTNKINRSPIIPKIELNCTECNLKFSTKKTLVCHLRNKHNNSRLVYVCPDCKETYANAWGVYRHLYKVHRKTSAQVKRLRQQVHNSIVRKDEEPHKKNEKKDADKADKTDEENQWLNNIEGDKDFQMCGGCGKRFERKAALHSHAQMCTKRIAVCNTIKENNAKKKEEESKDNKTKQTKNDKQLPFEAPLKGASKRKPLLLRTYKTVAGTASSFQTQNICDVNANTELSETVCDSKDPTVIVDDTEFNKKATNSPPSRLDDANQFEKNRECVCSEGKAGTPKLLSIIGVAQNEPSEDIKRESLVATPDISRCHTADDFDMFCQKVAERIRQTGLSESYAAPPAPQNANTSLEIGLERNNTLGDEDEVQCNTSLDVSPCRISIRSMEDLIGFPKEQEEILMDQEKPESNDVQEVSNVVPECPKTAISPKIRRSPRRPSKRKRTSSLDSSRNKLFKKCDFDSLIDKQDIGFTTKAAPYMDRKNLTCKTCHLTYPTFSKLLWHMSTHFSWYRFQCSRCSFITFSKSDCADHAKTKHHAAVSEISSIVLPIPNWKTVLMSNEFRELKDDPKHRKETSNVQKWCEKEANPLEGAEKVLNDNIIDTLFVDSDSTEVNTDIDVITFPLPMVKNLTCIKNESIDIVDKNEDSFQLEIPQEIYTSDAFEIIHIDDSDDDRYSFRTECNVKTEVADNDEFVILNSPGIAELGEELEEQAIDQTVEVLEDVVPKDNEFKEVTDPAINLRPTRNRVRSIKTLQNDFFYDLGKVIKLNESVVNKTSGPQKQKKNSGSANAKKEKGLKVYSNKR